MSDAPDLTPEPPFTSPVPYRRARVRHVPKQARRHITLLLTQEESDWLAAACAANGATVGETMHEAFRELMALTEQSGFALLKGAT